MSSLKEVVEDPNWFLSAIDLDMAQLSFVKANKSELSAASFLDTRFDTSHLEAASFGLREMLQHTKFLDAAPPRFVFHTAFCCSTLLARCLDLKDSNVSLKEPEVLMMLANYQRVGHKLLVNTSDAQSIYRLVTLLLFRPFSDGESVVVKPTNTVNNIITPLMNTHLDSKAVLLHSDLKSFMVSTLKKGERGRGFVRKLFNIFLMDSKEAQLLAHKQLLGMTDMQITAITWHLQLENFFDAVHQFGNDRVRSLHCDHLLNDSKDILARVIAHLQMPSLQNKFGQMLANAPLQQNAKTPEQAFSSDDRKREYLQTAQRYSESLETIIPWAEKLQFKYPYSERIGHVL